MREARPSRCCASMVARRGGLGLVWAVVSLCLLHAAAPAGAAKPTASVRGASTFNCAVGCQRAFAPVCGADGRTYSSPCLATCQGVTVAQDGPCAGEPILHPANTHVVASSESLLAPRHLHAFRHEGYRYTGQLSFSGELLPANRHPVRDPQQPQQQQQDPLQQKGGDGARAVRITREGHVYVADLDETVQLVLDSVIQRHTNATGSGSGSAEQPPHVDALLRNLRRWREYRPADGSAGGSVLSGSGGGGKWKRGASVAKRVASDGPREHALQPVLEGGAAASQQQQQQQQHREEEVVAAAAAGQGQWPGSLQRQARRSLGVFDTDDRIDCPRTPTYPFTAVGQISVRDASGNYVCSGALVGPDVVLTAAHCVFNRASRAFYDKLDFAPGRYRTADGDVVNPFGVVPWTYVTIYQAYSAVAGSDPNIVDIAVIKLASRVGSSAGWMGVLEPCAATAPSRYVALTAGYPSDQPGGSCKTTQCVVVQEPCTDPYLYHKCDTASGQSGSPLWMMAMTASRRMGPFIRAVHNIEWVQETASGKSISYINSAVGMTPDHYRSVLAWIAPSFLDTSSGSSSSSSGSGSDSTPMGPALPPNPSGGSSSSSVTQAGSRR